MRRLVILLATGVAAAARGVVAVDAANPPQTFTIEASYAFDVTDPEQLAGFADYVFIGRVVGKAGAVEVDERVFTDFQVDVDGPQLKGRLPNDVVVRQIGGTVGEDTWVLEDQPLLVPGRSYLLVAGDEPGQEAVGLGAGPLNVREVRTAADHEAAVKDWTQAVRDQRVPDALR